MMGLGLGIGRPVAIAGARGVAESGGKALELYLEGFVRLGSLRVAWAENYLRLA
jgi:hypothetical protein